VGGWLVGCSRIRPRTTKVFQRPVSLDARSNVLDLQRDVASWPVAQRPRYVLGALEAKGKTLLAGRARRDSYRERLEDALHPPHEGESVADALAPQLRCSRSTLLRPLRVEGTIVARVVVSVRKVTRLVGFPDPAAF
jgi:hypothetical protein